MVLAVGLARFPYILHNLVGGPSVLSWEEPPSTPSPSPRRSHRTFPIPNVLSITGRSTCVCGMFALFVFSPARR